MTLWARSELVRHREQRIARRVPDGADRPLLRDHERESPATPIASATACWRAAPSWRTRRAAERGLPALPKITPHSLRRTWAMLAAQAGRDPHWISDQIGHTSARVHAAGLPADAPPAPLRPGAAGDLGADALRR